MSWFFEDDKSESIITAQKHVNSSHGNKLVNKLPNTGVIFEIGMAMRHIEDHYDTQLLVEKLPCFLDNPKCIAIKNIPNICFTRGGYGSPAAVDTLETLLALGVRRVVVVGMCGVFCEDIHVGDIIVPNQILCEEGTSKHYVKNQDYCRPNKELFMKAIDFFKDDFVLREDMTVTTDAVYRQTFYKEDFWRRKGCVGVDMESSALLSVCQYYGIPAVSILLASDKHPLSVDEPTWEWGNQNFEHSKKNFINKCVDFMKSLS